jgi:hypothetical protein
MCPRVVFDHFQDTDTAEVLEHLRRVVLIAVLIVLLGEVQGVTEELPHVARQRHPVGMSSDTFS